GRAAPDRRGAVPTSAGPSSSASTPRGAEVGHPTDDQHRPFAERARSSSVRANVETSMVQAVHLSWSGAGGFRRWASGAAGPPNRGVRDYGGNAAAVNADGDPDDRAPAQAKTRRRNSRMSCQGSGRARRQACGGETWISTLLGSTCSARATFT